MLTLSCPSCGASVGFRSKASVFAVCTYCNSTVVRHDTHIELLGKMAEIQDEMTPVQIGTSGVFEHKPFDVIGRLKISYSDGVWNEWYCIFADGRTGWLAEAQGFWAMCFALTDAEVKRDVPARNLITIGSTVRLIETCFEVEDIHDVVCQYSEGELPFSAAKGRASTSVDLIAVKNEMATIEYSELDTRAYIGWYQEFDLFKFQNLREIDGW